MDSGPVFGDDEYTRRQSVLLSQLSTDSILLIPTNPMKIRSNDVYYPYRPSSDILYLSGWEEPCSLFCALYDDDRWVTSLFVRERDELAERWEGKRVGTINAQAHWPVDKAFPWSTRIEQLEQEIKQRKTIFLQQGLDDELDACVARILGYKDRKRSVTGIGPDSISDPSNLLAEMRMRKSDPEVEIMKKAANVAIQAHIRAMRQTLGDTSEQMIQAEIEHEFTRNLAEPSYGSIVAGGDNATILHYHKNDEEITEGSLVLIDAGCEVDGYASDITRTWPVNGKFSKAQREIYELVLAAQTQAILECKVGNHWLDPHKAAMSTISMGLIELGILNCTYEEAMGKNLDGMSRKYFMHGTSHSLGLDVHDVGVTRPDGVGDGRILESGMILTVEPGLYFPSWVDVKEVNDTYTGIGVRIEDDVLITDAGPVVLTDKAPKSVEDLERIIGTGV